MTATLREYWLILVLLLAVIATVGVSYGRVLMENMQHTVKLMEVRR